MHPQTWSLDPTRILTRRELTAVLADAKKTSRFANSRRNLVVVRLACCCGLRVSEIGGLELDDVIVDVTRPHLRLRRETTKGKRARMVPLWWDAGTLADLVAWKAERIASGAVGHDPFVCSVQAHLRGESLQRHAIRRRFLTACKVLGMARARTLTIHHGRHTFISHALAGVDRWPRSATPPGTPALRSQVSTCMWSWTTKRRSVTCSGAGIRSRSV